MHHIHGYKYIVIAIQITICPQKEVVFFCLMTLKLVKADIDGEALYIIQL